MTTELQNEIKPDEQLGVSDPLNSNADATQQQTQTPPSDPFSTLTSNEIIVQNGLIRSGNFVTNSAGWRIQASGNAEFNSGTFRGTLTAASIDIPDTTTANSFHVNSDGDAWWGATALASGVAWVKKDGSAKFTSGTIGGFTLGTNTLTATDLIINTTNQTIAVGASPNTITVDGSTGTITGKSGTWTLNGDGTITNVFLRKTITATKSMSDASGSTNYAHGLGVTPTMVKITAFYVIGATAFAQSFGVWDGTNTTCTRMKMHTNPSQGSSASNIVEMYPDSNDALFYSGTVTVDATNVTIAWTRTNTPTGTMQLLFEILR